MDRAERFFAGMMMIGTVGFAVSIAWLMFFNCSAALGFDSQFGALASGHAAKAFGP
jgi:hypothetical protein